MGTPLHQLMVEHLDSLGIDNTVFAPVRRGTEGLTKPNGNVIVSPCFSKADRCSFDYKQKKILRAVQDETGVSEADVIHAYTLFTDGNCAMKLSEKYNVPYAVAVRDTDVNYFFKYRPWLIGRGVKILKNAKAVFFLSETYKNKVLSDFVPQECREEIAAKTRVIPNGIDPFWIDNTYTERDVRASVRRIEDKQLKVICVAQICRRKNIPALQEALKKLEEKGWKIELSVIGKAEDEALLEKICADKNTTWLDRMPKEKLIDFYRASDIFALPSKTETFGLVYAEAATQGLPILYSKGQGFDGQFEEGKLGYHVDAMSPDDICEKLEKVAAEYEKLSGECIKSAGRFDWNDICGEYKAIYEEIIR